MSYTRESVIESYKKNGNVRGVCADTGCPPYNAYIWLKKAGVLSVNDKCSYGTASSRRGGEAEVEFQRLVPFAVSANKAVQNNMPSFDFMVGNVTIDVKHCSKGKHNRYRFETAKRKAFAPDFYCAFMVSDDGIKGGYSILLIPHEMTGDNGSVWVDAEVPELSGWWNFLIAPENLAQTLKDAADEMPDERPPVAPELPEIGELRAVKKISRAITIEANKISLEAA